MTSVSAGVATNCSRANGLSASWLRMRFPSSDFGVGSISPVGSAKVATSGKADNVEWWPQRSSSLRKLSGSLDRFLVGHEIDRLSVLLAELAVPSEFLLMRESVRARGTEGEESDPVVRRGGDLNRDKLLPEMLRILELVISTLSIISKS